MILNILLVIYSLIFSGSFVYPLDVTVAEVDANCHVLYTSGYGYNSFFHFPQSSMKEDGTIYLNFSVMAPSNAHILLSSKKAPSERDFVYEIVLGAGKNTYSTIRKLRTGIRISVNSANILSEGTLKQFWVYVSKNIIDVGKNGSSSPILHLKDPHSLDVKYLSFGAWVGVTATWIYDCKDSSSNVKPTKKLVGTKRLRSYLLGDYDPFAMPISFNDTLIITAAADVYHVNFDLKKSVLSTNAYFNFTWTDPKLSWNPTSFDSITSFKLYFRQIWVPDFTIFNSVKIGSSAFNEDAVTIRNDGQVRWEPHVQLSTRCDGVNVTTWPWDSHFCFIHIGLIANPFPVEIVNGQISMPKPISVGNTWQLVNIISEVDEIYEEAIGHANTNTLKILVQLKRHSSHLVYLFLLPIICVVITSAYSFLLPPYCSSRMHLHCISLVILTIYLLVLDNTLPTIHVPTPFIVSLTSRMLALVAFHIIASSFVNNFSKLNEHVAPFWFITKLLGNKSVRMFFFLPEGGLYNELDEYAAQPDRKYKSSWMMISVILDRIVFFISSFMIIIPILTIMFFY